MTFYPANPSTFWIASQGVFPASAATKATAIFLGFRF
jgi:hypothetical protein